ncbi:uncharacterized protein LOC122386259 [Amphibalanus amphitrite]|uniref:uncharacterized protein LOC122386259 n=1 Tax=Amphibalanus amphitrite TaxID=1232801 RepID=UPI001C913B83|nr:uncharacterized protein LOC122386259 [Amphibalanus amphitrite]
MGKPAVRAMEAGDSQLSDSEDSADTVLVPGARRALWEARARTAPAQRCAKVYTWLKMEDENGNRLPVPLQNSFEDLFAAPIRTVASSAAGGSKGSPGPRPAQQKDGSESKKRTLDGSKDNVSGDVKRTKVENGPVPVTDRKVQSSRGDSASERGAFSRGKDSVPTKNHKVQSDEKRVSSDKGSSSKESGHSSGSHRDKSKEHRKRDSSERSGGSSERSKAGSDSARSRTTSGGSSGCGSGTSPRSGSSSSDRKSTASASRQSSSGSRPAHKSSSKNKPHRRSSAESSASEVGSAKGGDKIKSPCKGEKDKAKSVPAKSAEKSKDKEKSASNPKPSTSKSHNDRNATTTSVIESTTSALSVEPNGTKKVRLKHASKSGDKDGKSSSSKSSEKPSSSTSDKGRATSVEKSTKSNCPDSPQNHSSDKHSTKHQKRSQSKNRHKDTSDSEKKSKSKEHSKQEKRKSSTKSHKEETSASVGCSESKKRGEKSSPTREHSDSKKKTKEATAGNGSSAPSAHAPDNPQCDTERANKTCDGTGSLDSKTPSPIIEDKTRPRSNSSGYNDSGSCSSDLLSEEKQPSLSHSNRVKIEKVDAHTESPGDGHVSAGAADMPPDETSCRNGDRHSPSHEDVSGPGRPGDGAGDIPKHPPASPSDDGSVDSVLDDPDMEGFDEFLENLERDITEGDYSGLKGALSSEHNSQETEADPPVRVKQEPADDGPVDVDPLSDQAIEETESVPVETADAAPKPTEASTAFVAPEEPGLFSSRSVQGRISPLQPVSDDGSTGVGAPPPSGSDAVCGIAGTPPRRSLWSDSEQTIPLLEPTSPVTLPRSPHRSAAAAANDSSAVPPDGATSRAPDDWTVPADLPAPRASEAPSVDQPPLISISSSDDDDGTRRAPPSPKHIFTLSSDSDEPDVICMLKARRRQAETSQSGVQSPLKRAAHEPPEDCRPEKRAARLSGEDVMTSDVEDDILTEDLVASPASSQRDDMRHESLEDSTHWEQLERVDSVAGDSTMDGDGVPSESAPIFTAGANAVSSDTAVAATDDSAVFPDATVSDSAVSPAAASAASPPASAAPADSEPTASAAAGTGTSLADRLEDIERLLARVSAAAPSGVEFDSARVTLDRLRELLRLTADDRELDGEHFLQMCSIAVRSVLCAACQVLDVPEKGEEGAGPEGEQGGPLPTDNERLTETATGASEADEHRSQHTWKQLSPSIPPELCTPIKDAFGEQYLSSLPPERAGRLVLTALRRLGPDYCPTLVSGSQLSAVFTATELGRATQWPGGKRWGNQIFSVYWSHLNADSGARGRLQRELLSGFDLLFRPPPVECPDTNLKQNMDAHCEFLPLNPFCVNETGVVAGAVGGPPGVCRPDRPQWRAETLHGAQDTLPGSSPHPDPTRPPHSAPVAPPHPPPLLTPPAKPPPPPPTKSPPKPSSPPASTQAADAASPEPQTASGSPAPQVDSEREQLSGSGAEEQLSVSGAEEQLSGTEEQLPGTESCSQHAESEPETVHRAEQESEPALSCGPEPPQELEQELVSSQELELGAELELEPDRATPARSPDGDSDRASLSEQDYDSDMSLGISSMEDGELGYDPGELSDAPPDTNQPAAAESDTPARPATGQAEASAGPATGQAEAPARLATGQAEAPARPATGQAKLPAGPATGEGEAPAGPVSVQAETPARPVSGQAETPAGPTTGQAEVIAKFASEQDGRTASAVSEQDGRTASAESVTSDQQDSDSLEEGELVSSSGEDLEPPAVRPRSRELPLQYRQPPAGRRYSRTPPRRPPSHAPSPNRAPRRRSGVTAVSVVLPPSRAAPVIRQIAIDQQPFPMPNSRRGDRRAAAADDEAEDISSDASLGTDSAAVRAGADAPGTPPAQPRTETPVMTAPAAESDGAAPETSPADVSPSKRHIINVDLMRQRLAAVRQQHSLIQPAAAVALSDALELTESVSSDSLPATAPSAAGAEDREQPEHPPQQQREQETESGEQTLSEISREESGGSPRPSSQLSEVSVSSAASRSEPEKRTGSPLEQPPEQPPRVDQPSAAPPDESDALSAQPSTSEAAARNRVTRKERPVTAGAPAVRQSSPAVRTPAAGDARPGVSSSDSESDTVRVVEDTSDPELEAAPAPAPTPSPTGRVRSSRPAERRAGARRSSEGGYWARL